MFNIPTYKDACKVNRNDVLILNNTHYTIYKVKYSGVGVELDIYPSDLPFERAVTTIKLKTQDKLIGFFK